MTAGVVPREPSSDARKIVLSLDADAHPNEVGVIAHCLDYDAGVLTCSSLLPHSCDVDVAVLRIAASQLPGVDVGKPCNKA